MSSRSSPAGVTTCRCRAVEPAARRPRARARRAGASIAERDDSSGEAPRRAPSRADRRRWRRARRPGRAPSRISALASAIASARLEEPEVRVADVGPDADVRLGDADERADFARVIHPELDDRHVRPVPQLQQRQRQTDVVVQVAPCSGRPDSARDRSSAVISFVVVLPALPVIATTRAPRSAPDVARELLQRPVVSSTTMTSAGRCRSVTADASCTMHARGTARERRRRRTRGRRTARRESRRTNRRRQRPRVDRDARRCGWPALAARQAGRQSRLRPRRRRSSAQRVHTPVTTPDCRSRRRASASRATLDVVERQHSIRRSPGTSRAPCRRSAPDRPGAPRAPPARSPPGDRRWRDTAWFAGRHRAAASGPPACTMPRLISSMIAPDPPIAGCRT